MRMNNHSLIKFGFEEIANDEFISRDLFSWSFLSNEDQESKKVQIGIYFKISKNKELYDTNAFMRRHGLSQIITGNEKYIDELKRIDENLIIDFHWAYLERVFIPLKEMDPELYALTKGAKAPINKACHSTYMPITQIDNSFEGHDLVAIMTAGEQSLPVVINIEKVNKVFSACSINGAEFQLKNTPDSSIRLFFDMGHYQRYIDFMSLCDKARAMIQDPSRDGLVALMKIMKDSQIRDEARIKKQIEKEIKDELIKNLKVDIDNNEFRYYGGSVISLDVKLKFGDTIVNSSSVNIQLNQ